MSTSVMAATTILKTWSNWTTSRSPRPINGFRESPEAEAEGKRVREHAHCLIAEGWGSPTQGIRPLATIQRADSPEERPAS